MLDEISGFHQGISYNATREKVKVENIQISSEIERQIWYWVKKKWQ